MWLPSAREASTPRPRPRRAAAKRGPGPSRTQSPTTLSRAALALLTTVPGLATAQSGVDGCIPLRNSRACPAFTSASISTNNALIRTYPFLQFVSDTSSFDHQLSTYIQTSYVRDKYQNVLGCQGVNFTDTTNMYARYTTTVLCNTLVQQSIASCGLSEDASRPVCADTCASYAQSEAYITADRELCASPGPDLIKLIRADFATCSLPERSLQGECIPGSTNEPENCGFSNSTLGLCSYCKAGGINSTDTCCYNADAERRCDGVRLPLITATMTFTHPTATSRPPSSTDTRPADEGDASQDRRGLGAGAIAGIVVGCLAGVALLALLLLLCLRKRRRGGSQKGSIFNQPSPARQGPVMSQVKQTPPEGYEVLPGGRVTRMSALEGHSSGSPTHHSRGGGSAAAAAAAAAAGGGYTARRNKGGDTQSSSDEYGDSPGSEPRGVLRPPPASRRQGSLSSGSLLASDLQSPGSGGDLSSPAGVASQNSEQLPFFKDYYSQDDIHPADRVAVLWAYRPRAPDEFALERGDMLKVVGIWDDGWATGVMLDERADEWEMRRQAQRDSGVSNTSEPRVNSPVVMQSGMKAFPLVCVCLPDHWRKTIEGDGSTETTWSGPAHGPPNP